MDHEMWDMAILQCLLWASCSSTERWTRCQSPPVIQACGCVCSQCTGIHSCSKANRLCRICKQAHHDLVQYLKSFPRLGITKETRIICIRFQSFSSPSGTGALCIVFHHARLILGASLVDSVPARLQHPACFLAQSREQWQIPQCTLTSPEGFPQDSLLLGLVALREHRKGAIFSALNS